MEAVILTVRLSDAQFGSDHERQRFLDLEDQITAAVEQAGIGSVDGHGFGDGTAELFMYGPDAEALFSAIEDLVRTFAPPPGSSALLQYCDFAATTRVVNLA
jgi:hypothetical protein